MMSDICIRCGSLCLCLPCHCLSCCILQLSRLLGFAALYTTSFARIRGFVSTSQLLAVWLGADNPGCWVTHTSLLRLTLVDALSTTCTWAPGPLLAAGIGASAPPPTSEMPLRERFAEGSSSPPTCTEELMSGGEGRGQGLLVWGQVQPPKRGNPWIWKLLSLPGIRIHCEGICLVTSLEWGGKMGSSR